MKALMALGKTGVYQIHIHVVYNQVLLPLGDFLHINVLAPAIMALFHRQ
jgi:hypothetical protein